MRVGLIVGPGFPVPPPSYGGTERVVDTLALGLTAAGHDVLLAAPSDSSCPVPRVRGMDPSDSTKHNWVPAEIRHCINAYAAMEHMDIIHDHTLIGPLFARRPGNAPTVTTMHGRLNEEMAGIYRTIASDTHIIAISHDQIRHYPDLPISKVIHHGMDISAVPVGEGLGGYACFLGRMCPDKGVLDAINIARQAGIPLRIAAKMREPAEIAYFREVIEPTLGPDEEMVGELGDADKFGLLGNAMALLNPLQWPEPFGLVMIEALATGTPVIGTASGAAPEIVDNGTTGFLAPVPELAGLLSRASELDRSACRSAAEQRFSATTMLKRHLELYQQVLSGNNHRVHSLAG